MGRTSGTYTLTSNIEPKVGAPLDARTIVKLLADLTANNTFEYPYKGMMVFVEENTKTYTLIGTDPTVSSNWVENDGGGHVIKNQTGSAMTQRSNLQFVDLTVSDDSTNDATKVENIHVIQSENELENLPDGLYMLDDDEGTVIDGNLVSYDNTDSELNAENVQDAIDEVVDALDDKIDISVKGVANGVAELDSAGKVPSSQLPSFVDDVLEYASSSAFPATGETGKIYVALDTNKTYRWGGTEYVEISESLALGETSSTAYRGDRGKTAYDHSQVTSGNPHNVTKSEVGLDNVDNTSDSTKKTNFTGSIASGNTGFVTGADAYTALGDKADKVSSATNGNLAGLNGSGNLTDSGWNGAKGTTSISGNPISIPNLKSNQLAVNPIITFEPIQDLHGQSKPYPAGGGKNLIPLTVDNMKAANVSGGSWSGNVWTSTSGVSFTIVTDSSDVVTGIKVNGTASDTTIFHIMSRAVSVTSGNYVLSGCPAGGNSTTTYSLRGYKDGTSTYTDDYGNGVALSSISTFGEVRIIIRSGYVANNLMFYPQVESGSSKTPFAPYSNICPISGYDKIEVLSCGVNIWDEEWELGRLDTSTGENIADNNRIRSKNYIHVIGGGTFYCYRGGNVSSVVACYYDAGQNFISSVGNIANGSFTVPANARYMRFHVESGYGTAYGNNISINYPSTQTSYVASNKTTSISESLGQTVYGGSLDVRTGVLLGDMIKTTITSISGTKPNYYASVSVYPDTTRNLDIVCDKMQTASSYGGSGVYINNNRAIMFVTSAYETAADLLAAFGGSVDVCYAVATPTEIQLTPHEISLLKDYAYLSTNGTTIALDYHNGELASLGDVAQVGETVNELGTNLLNVVEDVTSKFVMDSTNVYQSSMQVLKIGKMVFVNGSIRPQALTSLQNKKLFDITDSRLLPLVGTGVNITANFVPVETAQSTTLPLIVVINSTYNQLRTSNNGAYGGITNITTSSLIIFSGAYICRG